MKIILHIGQHKTGSTSLQYTLSKNRRELSKFKILYPRLTKWGFAHHALAPLFIGPDRTGPYLLRKMGASDNLVMTRSNNAWELVKQQVDKARPDALVLSSEALFHATSGEKMQRLGKMLRDISNQVELVIYLRDPASHALASVSNQIQVHANYVWPGSRSRREVIESYQGMNCDRIHVIHYDDKVLYNSDVVDDFAHRFLPKAVRLKKIKRRINPTLSAEAMSVMQQYVLSAKSYDQSRMSMKQQLFRKVLTKVDQNVEGYGKPQFLPNQRHTYLDGCMDLDWLKEQYSIDFLSTRIGQATTDQKLGCGPNGKISELCVIDPDRERKIRGIMRVFAPTFCRSPSQ